MVAPVGIGMLGLGVVGTGVLKTLRERADLIAERCGRPVELRRILVKDTAKPRPEGVAQLLVTDAEAVVRDPAVEIVIEVMGGEQPAYDYARAALAAGKHLVTANKELLARRGWQLMPLAAERGLEIGLEASVGGGIPIIAALRRYLVANRIDAVQGIVNGTTNYILTEMDEKGRDYPSVLREAQQLGYAEPDPTNDVEGFDSRFKLVILCALAFGVWPRPDDIFRRGITELHALDLRLARGLGYLPKLLAVGRRTKAGLEAHVQPSLVPASGLLGGVRGVFNAIQLHGDLVGDSLLYGRGAGPAPTASAIVSDLISIVRGERSAVTPGAERADVVPEEAVPGRFFLRIEPGAGAEAVADRLSQSDVGQAVVAGALDGTAALVVGPTDRRALSAAVSRLESSLPGTVVASIWRVAD